MAIPETTSAEGLKRYLGGKCLVASRGEAWRDIRASVYVTPSKGTIRTPAVSETVLLWTLSGEVEVEEREDRGAWIKSRISKESFFLSSGGAPYDCRWKTVSPEPFKYMFVLIELRLLLRALEEVFGAEAIHAHIRDVSGFTDDTLSCLMEQLHGELIRPQVSPLAVQGIAQLIAVHLVRSYAEVSTKPQSKSPSLPGYKLRQITDWMAQHFVEDINLDQLANQAGLSKFHFHRLFKRAVGISPSHYHTNLRINAAQGLLRESRKSIIEIAIEVGYLNPSHFAQLFRRETGVSPSEYRLQR